MAKWGSFVWGDGTLWGELVPVVVPPYEAPAFPPPLPTLTTPQEALDATYTHRIGAVFVDGVTVDALSWNAQFGVDQGVSTCQVRVPIPRPATVVANAPVEIQGGHNDLVGTMFSGRIPSWDLDMDQRGDLLTVRAVGWASLLAYPERFDLTYDGPITVSALFDSLCVRRGVPSFRADPVTNKDGTIEATLGGNTQIDGGKVIVPASQTPLTFLNNAAEPFGYRVYDTPDGTVRLSRVSGLPNTDAVVTFTEGVHLLAGRSQYSITGIVNYWEVIGQTYEDQYGASVPIRSFPAEIPSDPLIPVNDGVSYRQYRNSLLVTLQMAELVRERLEIDTSEPDTPVRWEAVAVPGVSVGDAVAVDCETVEANGTYWLMDLDLTGDERGLTATYDGWLGAGESLPAGVDLTTIDIQDAPLHLGDETLSHYAVPSPSGTSDTWDIEIPDRATAVNVRGLHHGTNSQLIGGVQTDLQVTKWQIWPGGTTSFPDNDSDNRPVRTGNMPIVNEDLAARKDYTNLANWSPFAVNLKSLDPGEYVLRLVCGEKAGRDDFEVRDVVLETYGTTEPTVLPEETEP